MIKISNVITSYRVSENALLPYIAKQLNISEKHVLRYEIVKKSLDARKKPSLKYIYTLAVELSPSARVKGELFSDYAPPQDRISKLNLPKTDKNPSVAIIGSGPCGLFSALALVEMGVKPVIFERGECVEKRVKSIELLEKDAVLNTNSNIQFGEGGAGTFSDGKLNTGTKSPFITAVLGEFAHFSQLPEINYVAKPHVGTDVLRDTILKIRKYLISRGAVFNFSTKVDDFIIQNNTLKTIAFSGENCGTMDVDGVILAIGHSARDTFELLLNKKVDIEQKPFSIGVRIEHRQSTIDQSQYGIVDPALPASDYKLATHLSNGRGVYTFCMCPGGNVVCGASEPNSIVTNGMSFHSRSGDNANSALLVSVNTSDFSSSHPLSGVEFQRKYERLAFSASNSLKAPVQLLGDLKADKVSTAFGSVTPTYPIGTVFADLKSCLPAFAVESIVEATPIFDRKLHGFNAFDSLLTGVETRSSSPVKILRDESFQSNILNLFPSGEGCGYAGGITSAAVDGIKSAVALVNCLMGSA